MDKPKYIIVAGVNGAGKSTLFQTYPEIFMNTKRVNADEILRKNHGDWQNQKDNILAGRETVKKIQYNIANQISFHQETTLASSLNGFLKNIQKAKQKGFQVELLYVSLDTPQRAIERVNHRVQLGGHGIPNDVITKRYFKSLENLKEIVKYVDSLQLFDNSQYLKRITKIERKYLDNWLDQNTLLPKKREILMVLAEQQEREYLKKNILEMQEEDPAMMYGEPEEITAEKLQTFEKGLTGEEWLAEDIKSDVIAKDSEKSFTFPKEKISNSNFQPIEKVAGDLLEKENEVNKSPKI